MILRGNYYYPKKSGSITASLEVVNDKIIVKTDDLTEIQRFDIKQTKINSKLGSIPRKFNFLDGSFFESSEHEKIDSLLKRNNIILSSIDHSAHRLENSLKALVLLSILGLLTLGFLYYKGVPWLSRYVAFNLPAKVQIAMGNQVLAILDKTIFVKSSLPEQQKTLMRQYFNELLANIDLAAKLHFRGGGQLGANAVAIPNGDIVITDELIELADYNKVAIQGVLAHEIGHLHARHSLRQAITLSIVPVFLALVTGDLVNSSQIASSIPIVLMEQGYNRDFEREADRFSRKLLWKMGIDTRPVAKLFADLAKLDQASQKSDDSFSLLSTHPGYKERIEFFVTKITP